MLLGASALSPAAGADSADAFPAGAPLYAYFHELAGGARSAPRPDNSAAHLRGQFRALAAPHRPVAGSAPSLDAPVDAPVSELRARLHCAFGGDLVLSGEAALDRAALFGNADAFVQTKMRFALGREQRGFVYADMGAADSALKWQGLAGIHARADVDLVGGWRHVTYRFSPGNGFDSLDFNGPFLGATLAW